MVFNKIIESFVFLCTVSNPCDLHNEIRVSSDCFALFLSLTHIGTPSEEACFIRDLIAFTSPLRDDPGVPETTRRLGFPVTRTHSSFRTDPRRLKSTRLGAESGTRENMFMAPFIRKILLLDYRVVVQCAHKGVVLGRAFLGPSGKCSYRRSNDTQQRRCHHN